MSGSESQSDVIASARPRPSSTRLGADLDVAVNPAFSRRQRQVIRLLAQGRTDPQIAAALSVSLRTVHYDIAGINRELGVNSRFAAGVRLALLGMVA